MKKRIQASSVGLIICILVIYTEIHNWYFAEFVNKFFPCQQKPDEFISMPRYLQLLFMAVAAVIGIAFLGILLYNEYKRISK